MPGVILPCGGGGGGGITEVTSSDGTITVGSPFGPIVDLSYVANGGTELLIGGTTSFPATGGSLIDWGHSTGPNLLDLTIPSAPALILGGLYAVVFLIQMNSNLNVGFELFWTSQGVQQTQSVSCFRISANTQVSDVGMTLVGHDTAGGLVALSGVNNDSAARTFATALWVTRLF